MVLSDDFTCMNWLNEWGTEMICIALLVLKGAWKWPYW